MGVIIGGRLGYILFMIFGFHTCSVGGIQSMREGGMSSMVV